MDFSWLEKRFVVFQDVWNPKHGAKSICRQRWSRYLISCGENKSDKIQVQVKSTHFGYCYFSLYIVKWMRTAELYLGTALHYRWGLKTFRSPVCLTASGCIYQSDMSDSVSAVRGCGKRHCFPFEVCGLASLHALHWRGRSTETTDTRAHSYSNTLSHLWNRLLQHVTVDLSRSKMLSPKYPQQMARWFFT